MVCVVTVPSAGECRLLHQRVDAACVPLVQAKCEARSVVLLGRCRRLEPKSMIIRQPEPVAEPARPEGSDHANCGNANDYPDAFHATSSRVQHVPVVIPFDPRRPSGKRHVDTTL